MTNDDAIDLVIRYAFTFLGRPYLWGGDGPTGYDCSGLIQELLKSVGIDPPGDQSASELFKILAAVTLNVITKTPVKGALCFYGPSAGLIVHVAICIDDTHIIEAGGGDHTVVDLNSAEIKGAKVRIRPFNYRKDLVSIILPRYVL